MSTNEHFRSFFTGLNPWLVTVGTLFLVYALLGNYVALPGYIRFLERGGTSAAGNTFDLAVVIGATKTIVWMYSFQLGTLALACAYSARHGLHTTVLLGVCFVWLTLWSWPTLPQPGAWFYVCFGFLLIVAIALTLLGQSQIANTKKSKTLFLLSIIFFAFATWEVCGLGTAGRMLHPEQSSSGLANSILITQSSKLMIEFVFAWTFLLCSLVIDRREGI